MARAMQNQAAMTGKAQLTKTPSLLTKAMLLSLTV
jgi:hypothetical protein